MKELFIKDEFVKGEQYQGNKDIEEVGMVDAVMVLSYGIFKDCTSLKRVYFGLDITRIGNATFENCTSLTDVYFAITDAHKIVEIGEDAFRGCNQPIIFHICVPAVHNKSLNEYAKRHGFKVVGMI